MWCRKRKQTDLGPSRYPPLSRKPSSGSPPDVQLTEDDYFLKSPEFKHWLKTDRETPFDQVRMSTIFVFTMDF